MSTKDSNSNEEKVVYTNPDDILLALQHKLTNDTPRVTGPSPKQPSFGTNVLAAELGGRLKILWMYRTKKTQCVRIWNRVRVIKNMSSYIQFSNVQKWRVSPVVSISLYYGKDLRYLELYNFMTPDECIWVHIFIFIYLFICAHVY